MASKRRMRQVKAMAEKRASKAAGMKNPGGESKYAQKRRTGIRREDTSPGHRESWMVRCRLGTSGVVSRADFAEAA